MVNLLKVMSKFAEFSAFWCICIINTIFLFVCLFVRGPTTVSDLYQAEMLHVI